MTSAQSERQLNHFDIPDELPFKQMSLRDLVRIGNALESILDQNPDDIDPATVIGKLISDSNVAEEFRESQRDKIDAINAFIGSLEALIARWEIRRKRAAGKKGTGTRILERFKQYLLDQMRAAQMTEMRGNEFLMRMRNASNPAVYVDDVTPEIAMRFPSLVTIIPEQIVWNDEACRDQLKPFYKLLKERDDCQMCSGRGQIPQQLPLSEDDEIPREVMADCPACLGLKKDLTDLEIPDAIHAGARLGWSQFVEFLEYDGADELMKPRRKKGKK